MTTRFSLDPDKLETIATDVRTAYEGDFSAALGGLRSVAQALPQSWTSDTQRRFNELYSGWADHLAVLGRDLILIEGFLRSCASEYRRLDGERRQASAGLPARLAAGGGRGPGLAIPLRADPDPAAGEPVDNPPPPPLPQPPRGPDPAAGEPTGSAGAPAGQHVVRAGDSLWAIAQRYGVTVDALRQANHLTGNTIYPGQTLRIPGSGYAPTPGQPSGPDYGQDPVPGDSAGDRPTPAYTVKPGDTLFSIAQQFGVTVADLQATNAINGTVIYAGQPLLVPGLGQAPDRYTGLVNANECPTGTPLAECFSQRRLLDIPQGATIEPADFQALQVAVAADITSLQVRDMTPDAYMHLRLTYDTPFWNGADPDVLVEVNGQLYRQSEVNYFAQGMLAAARGNTLEQAYAQVVLWKAVYLEVPPSEGALYWTQQGYDEFLRLQGSSPDSVQP